MKRVLVTGGAGYIGSHTAKILSRCGFEPVVIDDFSTGHRWAIKWGQAVEGSLADEALVRSVLATHRIEAVIHFAAHAYVGESIHDPRKYLRNNVLNTLNVLDAIVAAGVRNIVFSSTCATYGVPEASPITEEVLQRPINPYGDSKLFIERALQWYGAAYGLRWMALRYFNAAGADPDGDLGEEHFPEPHLIPRVIDAALGKLDRIEVYGDDYETPDGTAIRDYIHVSDLASAHVKALQYLMDGNESTAVNLGTGKGHSVQEVVGAIERIAGAVPVKISPRREGDPPCLVANPSKAAELLQWRPQYSSIETIAETALHWRASRYGLARPHAIRATAPLRTAVI